MNRAQHTPGPWEAGVNPKGMYTNEVVVRPAGQFPHGEWIADCGPNYPEDSEPHANARLIAAAPDLLAALKSLCDADATYVASKIHIDCDSHGDAIQRMRIAREAIAKAEGRS